MVLFKSYTTVWSSYNNIETCRFVEKNVRDKQSEVCKDIYKSVTWLWMKCVRLGVWINGLGLSKHCKEREKIQVKRHLADNFWSSLTSMIFSGNSQFLKVNFCARAGKKCQYISQMDRVNFFCQVWTWKENVTDLFPDLEDSRMVFFAVLLCCILRVGFVMSP